MAKERRSKLGDWLIETLQAHPDGLTVAAITALGRSRHSHKLDRLSVVNELNAQQSLGHLEPGPWLKADGTPATKPNTGGCVRYWYAKEHAPS